MNQVVPAIVLKRVLQPKLFIAEEPTHTLQVSMMDQA